MSNCNHEHIKNFTILGDKLFILDSEYILKCLINAICPYYERLKVEILADTKLYGSTMCF